MSIHDRLTEAYRQSASRIGPGQAANPDARVLAEFEKYAAGKRGIRPKIRWKPQLLQLAVVAVLIGVLSGFAHYVSVRIHDERVSIRYEEGIHQAMDASLQAEVQSLMQQVRSQLAESESAVIYSPSIGQLFPELVKMPLISVSKPAVTSDWTLWRKMLAQEAPFAELPDLSGSGLSFDGGERERLMVLSEEDRSLLPELQREAKERADEGKLPAAWRIRPVNSAGGESAPELSLQYTSIFRDAARNQVEIGVRRVSERADVLLSVGRSASRESTNLDGAEAVYVKNEHYIGADSVTGQYQMVQWLSTQPDSTLVYSVGSESLAVTKDELVRIARQMISGLNP
ncbi:hypothetical protein [Paenibacillus kobensis]|uniref:hypothetical protein n=1 Tax=Paenibacillus kobensis TaxID=59841 RepID=UPI000FD9A2FA|nr:hypothetical protein [Paenibacillus kobensis]